MATTSKEGYVDLFIQKGFANEDPNLLISVNGKNFVLPRGKTSKVPSYVKAEYERSLRAEAALDKKSEELLKKTEQPIYIK
jgi:predicted aconitase with swiveling domain